MKAKRKNTLLSFIIGLPLWTYWTMDQWRFWVITMPIVVIYAALTQALPVFSEPRRRKL